MQVILNDLTVIFLSILLEALPFVLLGSLIASAISLFLSDSMIYRLIPKNRLGGLVAVSFLGLIFPVCDCTIIPVMRRLIRKGMPSSLAVTFMCAVPIVNPTVILSTVWAFTGQAEIVWMRMFVGVWVAIAAGYTIGKITGDINPLRDKKGAEKGNKHLCGCEADDNNNNNNNNNHDKCTHGCTHDIHKKERTWRSFADTLQKYLQHTTIELLENGAFIVIGALLSAIIQVIIPRTILYPLSSSSVGSVGVMMCFTWLISLCANADAFIAKSFYGIFSTGSIIAFMTFGQMVDLKNSVVLLGFFKKRFVITVVTVISMFCFAWGLFINLMGRG